MSWGGHALDAINRLKNNKIMRESRKHNRLRTKYREEVLKVQYKKQRPVAQNEITQEEKDIIRKRIRYQIKIGRIKSIIAFVVVVTCLFLFFYLVLNLNS